MYQYPFQKKQIKWNGIHEIIKIRPKETNYVTSLRFNNTLITDLIANFSRTILLPLQKNRTKNNSFNIQILLLFEKSLLKKLKTFYGCQLPQGHKATMRRQFTFYHQVPRISWYSFDQPQKDERLS